MRFALGCCRGAIKRLSKAFRPCAGCGRDLSVAFRYSAMQGSSSGGSIVVTQQGCVLVRAFNAQTLAWPRDAALLLPRCTR
jgi:hypothetical protein